MRAPAGHKVHDLLIAVSGIEVEEGDPMIEFAFGSPEGTITFSADNPVGVKFPGFEEGDTGSGGANTDDKGDYKFPGMPELLPTSGGDDDEDDNESDEDDSDEDDSDDDSVEVSDVDSDED